MSAREPLGSIARCHGKLSQALGLLDLGGLGASAAKRNRFRVYIVDSEGRWGIGKLSNAELWILPCQMTDTIP